MLKDSNEEIDGQQEPLLAKHSPQKKRPLIIYSLLFACLACYTVGVLSSQVSGLQGNVFQLNSLAYFFQFLVALCCFPCQRYSLKVSKKHIGVLLGAVISNVGYTTCFPFAASFMPVGNLDAFFVALYIVCTTCFDLYKGTVTWKSVLISAVILVGIVIMTQPWNITHGNKMNTMVPCDYLDCISSHNQTNSKLCLNNDTHKEFEHQAPVLDSKFISGFGLILISAVSCTCSGNVLKISTTEYATLTAMFWISLFQGILSLFLSLLCMVFTSESYLFFPPGRYCRMFVILFIVSIAFTNIFSYFSYRYIPISTVAMANAIVTVVLYICQRTFLSVFHPGNANLPEVLGLVIVIFGAAVMPVIFLFVTERNKDTSN